MPPRTIGWGRGAGIAPSAHRRPEDSLCDRPARWTGRAESPPLAAGSPSGGPRAGRQFRVRCAALSSGGPATRSDGGACALGRPTRLPMAGCGVPQGCSTVDLRPATSGPRQASMGPERRRDGDHQRPRARALLPERSRVEPTGAVLCGRSTLIGGRTRPGAATTRGPQRAAPRPSTLWRSDGRTRECEVSHVWNSCPVRRDRSLVLIGPARPRGGGAPRRRTLHVG